MPQTEKLLAQYVKDGSEPAFEAIVAAHVNLVYGTAVRILQGDVHAAKDMVQIVFNDLARKAGRIPPEMPLAGWLHQHTVFVCSKYLRQEARRRRREQEAMRTERNDPVQAALEIAPLLDEAIQSLNSTDRLLIVLRYLEQNSFKVLGETLSISEDAARMRTSRAVERLQALLTKRGITPTGMALGTILTGGLEISAPAGLVASVARHALVGGLVIRIPFLNALLTSKSKLAGAMLTLGTLALAIHTLRPAKLPERVTSASAVTSAQPVRQAEARDSTKLNEAEVRGVRPASAPVFRKLASTPKQSVMPPVDPHVDPEVDREMFVAADAVFSAIAAGDPGGFRNVAIARAGISEADTLARFQDLCGKLGQLRGRELKAVVPGETPFLAWISTEGN